MCDCACGQKRAPALHDGKIQRPCCLGRYLPHIVDEKTGDFHSGGHQILQILRADAVVLKAGGNVQVLYDGLQPLDDPGGLFLSCQGGAPGLGNSGSPVVGRGKFSLQAGSLNFITGTSSMAVDTPWGMWYLPPKG